MSRSRTAGGVAAGVALAVGLLLSGLAPATFASPPLQIGDPAATTCVPAWDAAGLGQLPWQGVSCAHLSADGKWVAVGTIAPPAPAPGRYGPDARTRDERVWAPLSIAIDGEGKRVAVADYEGYERFVLPRTPDEALRPPRSIGVRFHPSRPAIRVYDTSDAGREVRRFDPARFEKAGWFDLAFGGSGDAIAYLHHLASRGLAARPFVPADDEARTLYVLSVQSGDVLPVRFPDAISDVATAGGRTMVACWNGRVYLLGPDHRPIPSLPNGLEVGKPSLVQLSADGGTALVATSAGVLHRLDAVGREVWKIDPARAATPGEKPWAKGDRKGSKIGSGVWRNNTGRTPSDLGCQIVIEAPDGLLLVDPNSGLSFEQNWAMMKAEGLDPMRVKYVLPTHEHGDHAPGAVLWRAITGAKVIASLEMAYTLQHDLPYTSGYGFPPPVPVDILVDRDTDMDLCGLKVRLLRLPGHTFGSMGCLFELGGRRYVTTGDLIMPEGPLGYSGSVNLSAPRVLKSLRKLDQLKPDYVLCGHADGPPDRFIGAGIRAGEATGWGKMNPPRPDPTFGLANKDYQVVGWLETIYAATFGDIDGDGLPDAAIVTPADKGLELKVYLNKRGRFEAKPDRVVDVPRLGPATKVRIGHLTAGKTADFLVSTESEAVLLLADTKDPKDPLAWRAARVKGAVRAVAFAADRTLATPECVIGQRFVQGCRLCRLLPDGSLKTGDGPKMGRQAMDLVLVDVNGDGKSDLVTVGGEVFLRGADGKLPDAATMTLDRPYGGWTYLGVGNFNGDEKPDVALVGKKGLHVMAAVFYNTGDRRQPFRTEPDAEIDLGQGLEPVRDGPTVADFDNDGIDDLLIPHSERQNIVIVPGSRRGLDRGRSTRLKVDYNLHNDTKVALLDLDGKGTKALAGFGTSAVGAPGVYVRMPERGGR